MSADQSTVPDCAISDAFMSLYDKFISGTDSSHTIPSNETTYPVYTPSSQSQQAMSSFSTQSSNRMFLPDYLGGLLPTEQGYNAYMATKLREVNQKVKQLTCPHCEKVCGNAGSYTRHVGACKKRPEVLAELKDKSTCPKCKRVL